MEPPRQGFFDDFYNYAEKHAGKPEATEAWAMVLTMSRCSSVGNGGYLEHPGVTRAIDCLVQHHAADPEIEKAITIIRRQAVCIRFDSLERFYLAVEAKNKDKEIIATCRLARAEMHQRPYLFRGMGWYAEHRDDTTDQEAAEKLMNDLVRDYPGTAAGKNAEAWLFKKTTLGIGRPFPDFEGQSLEGKTLRLSQFRGKVVMVVFWASWCGSCMASVPEEHDLAVKFADQPFVILGVNSDRTKEDFKRCLEKRKEMTWQNIFDGDPNTGPIAKALRIHAFPTVYLLDHAGVIRHEGLYGERLQMAIESLIKDVQPAKPASRPAP